MAEYRGRRGEDLALNHFVNSIVVEEQVLIMMMIIVIKPVRAESARAFTGRRCSHSGRGEDFLTGQLNFFTKTAVTPEQKVKKWFPTWEINRHAEG